VRVILVKDFAERHFEKAICSESFSSFLCKTLGVRSFFPIEKSDHPRALAGFRSTSVKFVAVFNNVCSDIYGDVYVPSCKVVQDYYSPRTANFHGTHNPRASKPHPPPPSVPTATVSGSGLAVCSSYPHPFMPHPQTGASTCCPMSNVSCRRGTLRVGPTLRLMLEREWGAGLRINFPKCFSFFCFYSKKP
jgi:hypothetical protein